MRIKHAIVKLQAAVSGIKTCADVVAPSLGANVHATLLRLDAIVGDFIKLLGFSDSVALTDAQVIAFEKAVSEVLSLVEQVALELSKPLHDQVHITEIFERSIDKLLDESKQVLDVLTKSFNKAISPEVLIVTDTAVFSAVKSFIDPVYQLEGPAFGQTYVDPTYLAQDYVWDGGPVKHVGKVLVDATSTFDILKAASTKGLVEEAYVDDVAAKAFTQSGVIDVLGTDDVAVVLPIKRLLDTTTYTEILVRSVDTQATDVAIAGESYKHRTDKVLSEFPLSATDLSTFSLTKVAEDVATSNDVTAYSVAQVKSDTATSNDAANKMANKSLTDVSVTGDNGHLRMIDYTDIEYFAQDYVGIIIHF